MTPLAEEGDRGGLDEPSPKQTSVATKSVSQVSLRHDVDQHRIVIDDADRVTWLDGVDIYWKLPRDVRPSDFSPSEYFDGYDQALYQLDDLARRYPLNKVPATIVANLEKLQQLSKLYEDYKNHVLGLILKPPKFKDEPNATLSNLEGR